jgi:hypothetical protein
MVCACDMAPQANCSEGHRQDKEVSSVAHHTSEVLRSPAVRLASPKHLEYKEMLRTKRFPIHREAKELRQENHVNQHNHKRS